MERKIPNNASANLDGYAFLLKEIFFNGATRRPEPKSNNTPVRISADGADLILEVFGNGLYGHWYDWYHQDDQGPIGFRGRRYRLVRALDKSHGTSEGDWGPEILRQQSRDLAFWNSLQVIQAESEPPRKTRGRHFGQGRDTGQPVDQTMGLDRDGGDPKPVDTDEGV